MSRPQTICQVLHSMRVGGAEMLAAGLARQLSGEYRFVFACLDEVGTLGEQLRSEGFDVHLLGRKPGRDWGCAWRLARYLKQQGAALIHAHQYTPLFYTMLARLFRRKPPILFTEHGRHFPDYPRRKRMWMNRLFLGRRDRIVGVGAAVRQALIDNEGFSPQSVQVIYNGIPLSYSSASAQERAAVRKEMGVEEGDWVMMQVARLDYLKDHGTALRALARLLPRSPRARLVLVGEGPELPRIQEQIHRDHLEPHVRLLGLRTDVSRLLGGADLFLLTSISEGIPLTVIEAMAAGLPVVGTDVGGMREVVEDGKTGLLSPAGDDASLADTVLRFLDDPDLRRRAGELGRQRAEQLFSQGRMHAAYLRLYREMLEGSPRRGLPVQAAADSAALGS